MTRRRFFAPPNAFNYESETVTLDSEETRHLRDVLRLKPGEEVFVFDGDGREFCCSVSKTSRDSAELEIRNEVAPARPESTLSLTLTVALLKGEKFDLVVQKATELGVNRVVPLITRYADIHLRDESDARKRVSRWQRIALESAKQSGRAIVPDVGIPISFESVLKMPTNNESLRLMFSERGGQSLSELVHSRSMARTINALVGSEGGWSDDEIEQARTAGLEIVTLAGRILRAETAAIATSALLQHIYGDLR